MTTVDTDRTLPAHYLRELVDLCRRFDVAPHEVLRGTQLEYETLADPSRRVPLDIALRLGRNAIALTGEPGLAFHVGLHMRISWHGFLGFAAMTASTIREALRLAERFASTKTTAIRLALIEDGETASFTFEERVAIGRELHEFLAIAIFSGLKHIAMALTGEPVRADVDFAFSEPAYASRFRHMVPGEARFDQPVSRIRLTRATLDTRIVSADPVAMQLALDQCERELAAMAPAVGFVEAVRKHVQPRDGEVASIEAVARAMHVSTRTLKRRLADHGTTYRDVVDEIRQREAMLMLRDRRLTLDEIATRLGYSDVANFTRAFRRWTGTTPAASRG